MLLSYCSFNKIFNCLSISLSEYLFGMGFWLPASISLPCPYAIWLTDRQRSLKRRLYLWQTSRYLTESFFEAQPAAQGVKQQLTWELGFDARGCSAAAHSLPGWVCQTDGEQRRCSQRNDGVDLAKCLLTFPMYLEPFLQLLQGEQLRARGSFAACPTWSPVVLVVQGSVRSQAQMT